MADREAYRRRCRAALMALTAILLAACSSGTGSSGSSNAVVNIGVPGAFTGQFSLYGEPFFEGVQTAADLINKSGGILGHQVNVIPVDTAGDPVDTVPAIRQMLAADNISASIGLAGEDFQDAIPVLNQSHMVSFIHVGSPAVDKLTLPYVFNTSPTDSLLGSAMAFYASVKGYTNLALVFDASTTSQSLVPGILKAAKVLNLNIVANEALPAGAASYEAAIQQIVNAKPDVVLLQLQPNAAGTFFHEFTALGGANLPVIASDLSLETSWFNAVGAPEVAKNVLSVTSSTQVSGPGYQTFLQAYQARYKRPPQYLSLPGYDGMMAAALAMVDAKSTDPSVYYKSVLDVTTPTTDATVVTNFADGAAALAQGKKIKYLGIATPMTYNQYHQLTGNFEVDKQQPSLTPVKIADIAGSDLVKLNQ